jgi:hypothetical protein
MELEQITPLGIQDGHVTNIYIELAHKKGPTRDLFLIYIFMFCFPAFAGRQAQKRNQ